MSKLKLPLRENVLVESLNVFSLLIFQEIICQKNTVSTQSNLFISPCLCLSHIAHPLLTHTLLCGAKNMLFLRAKCTVSNTLCFSSCYYEGFLFCGPLLFCSCDKCWFPRNVKWNHLLFHYQDMFLRWRLCHEFKWLHGRHLRKNVAAENLTCKKCSIQIRFCLSAKESCFYFTESHLSIKSKIDVNSPTEMHYVFKYIFSKEMRIVLAVCLSSCGLLQYQIAYWVPELLLLHQ